MSIKEQLEVIRRQMSQLSDSVEAVDAPRRTDIQADIGACVIALNTLALMYKTNIAKTVEVEAERLESLNRKHLQNAKDTLSILKL
jgi:hypothetical protein